MHYLRPKHYVDHRCLRSRSPQHYLRRRKTDTEREWAAARLIFAPWAAYCSILSYSLHFSVYCLFICSPVRPLIITCYSSWLSFVSLIKVNFPHVSCARSLYKARIKRQTNVTNIRKHSLRTFVTIASSELLPGKIFMSSILENVFMFSIPIAVASTHLTYKRKCYWNVIYLRLATFVDLRSKQRGSFIPVLCIVLLIVFCPLFTLVNKYYNLSVGFSHLSLVKYHNESISSFSLSRGYPVELAFKQNFQIFNFNSNLNATLVMDIYISIMFRLAFKFKFKSENS
uniref:G_PROTEIN_RECEP_F1_2 domain-containing protein n=1 Tax=Heterorhabditis bacteriophora TaxID=37862 RepID=A0A1I7WF11_HETBA